MADRTLNLQLQEMANHRQTQQNAPRTHEAKPSVRDGDHSRLQGQ
jgi:hypothetical protein